MVLESPSRAHEVEHTRVWRPLIATLQAVFISTAQCVVIARWTVGIAALAAAVLAQRPLTRSIETAAIASQYLDIAANLAWCGRYPIVIARDGDGRARLHEVDRGMAGGNSEIIRYATNGTGSRAEFCRYFSVPILINEVSLSLIEAWLLRMVPDVTFRELADYLVSLRVAAIGVFGLLLIQLHCPIILVFGAVASALYLTVLLGGNALFSQYPFFLPLTLLGIGGAGLVLASGLHRRPTPLLIAAAALGVWAGLLGNLRTSLYPGAVAVGILFLLLSGRDRRRHPNVAGESWRFSRFAAMAWLLGLVAFDVVYIRPLRAIPALFNSSNHTVMHPLVLGLANPPNELARREGITWNDPAGLALARRIDPGVAYLGPGYETALWRYYRGLWAEHPGEMAGIYRTKFLHRFLPRPRLA